MSAQVPLIDVPVRKLSFTYCTPLKDIQEADGFNPRTDYGEDDGTFAALVESIRLRGILQPPLLRPLNLDKYGNYDGDNIKWAIVAGHRRIAAAREAGLTELEVAAVHDAGIDITLDKKRDEELKAESLAAYTEADRLLDALTENSHRKRLNAIEEARAFVRLTEMGLSQDAIGKASGGKGQAHVSRTLKLLSLPDLVVSRIAAGSLSRGQAEELLPLLTAQVPEPSIIALASGAAEGDWSCAAVRGHVKTLSLREGAFRPLPETPALFEMPTAPVPPAKGESTNAAPHTPAAEAPAPVRHEAPARGESDTRHSVENQRASAEATRTLEAGPRPAPATEPTDLEKWAIGRFGSIDSALGVFRTMDSRVAEGFIYVPDDEMVFRLGRLVEHRRAEGPEFANVLAAQVLDGLIYRRCVELDLEGSAEAIAPAPTVEETASEPAPADATLDGFEGCMAAIRSSFTPKRFEQLFAGRDSERVQAMRWVCNLLEREKYEEPTLEEWNLARDYLLGHADVMPAPFELRNVPDFHKAILKALKMSNTEAHVTASMSYAEMIDALSKRMSEGGGQSGPKNGWWGVDWKGGTKPKLELSWRWIKPDGEYSESKSVTLTGKNLYEAIVAALNWKESSNG